MSVPFYFKEDYTNSKMTHSKSPPAVDIGNEQAVAGDPHRTAASRHT